MDKYQPENPPNYHETVQPNMTEKPTPRAAAYVVPPGQPAGGYVNYAADGQNFAAPPQVTPVIQAMPRTIFNDVPVQCTCPNCQKVIVTETERTSGILVWLIFGFLLLIGCWLGCCLIPFCIDSIKDTNHYCPSCRSIVGRHHQLS